MLRRALLLALALALVGVAGGCGRELPEAEDENVPEGGDPTGAFGEPEEGGGGVVKLRVAGVEAAVALGRAAARGFAPEAPDAEVVLAEREADAAVADLCAGKIDVAGVDRELIGEEREACAGAQEGAVELKLAEADGAPVYLVTTQKQLFDKLELETYLDFIIQNGAETAQQAGLEPIPLEELDEAQTRFEQGLAGVG